MVRLKVTAKGQITLKREVLDHLGIRPGDEVEVNLQSRREATLHPISGKLPIQAVFGMFENTTGKSYSLDDLDEAVAESYTKRAKR